MRRERTLAKAIDMRSGDRAGIALAIIAVVNGLGSKLNSKFGSISASLK